MVKFLLLLILLYYVARTTRSLIRAVLSDGTTPPRVPPFEQPPAEAPRASTTYRSASNTTSGTASSTGWQGTPVRRTDPRKIQDARWKDL